MNDVQIRAVSRSMDASLLALADLSDAAARAHVDHRVVGGQVVTLHTAVARVTGLVPDRDTADADAGIPRAAADAYRLHDALLEMGYQKAAGDRLVRERGALTLAIDVVIPTYTSRRRHNVTAGPFVATEAGGLTSAFGQPPEQVHVQAILTDGARPAPITVQLPTVLAAIGLKAYAWSDREEHRDALDMWRLLTAAEARAIRPADWPTGAVGGAGAELVRQQFGRATAPGTVAATDDAVERATIAALVARVMGPQRPPARSG